jgi:anthranilate phosphoribosyltransferase
MRISELLTGDPPREGWERLFRGIFEGRVLPEELRKLLLLLSKRGEEVDTVLGCLRAVRRLEPPRRVHLPYLVDVCGTGGDGAKSFNISTVSSFVIAAAGAYVAKHGNRAVSSAAGSTDLMEALGIRIDPPFEAMQEALERFHLAYFHAPFYHPSFSRVQPVRRELGVRTVFNLLGPLVNPVEVRFQMIGVSNPDWLEPLGSALRSLGRRRAVVFRSRDGLDELSSGEMSDILYMEQGKTKRFRLNPRALGFRRATRKEYQGGDVKANREIALGIVRGRLRGPRQDVVLLNSGFALWLVGLARTIDEGIARARWAIRSGRAAALIEVLGKFTRECVRR